MFSLVPQATVISSIEFLYVLRKQFIFSLDLKLQSITSEELSSRGFQYQYKNDYCWICGNGKKDKNKQPNELALKTYKSLIIPKGIAWAKLITSVTLCCACKKSTLKSCIVDSFFGENFDQILKHIKLFNLNMSTMQLE